MRTGILWRDIPKEFGLWNTLFRRFNLWPQKGILNKVFQKLSSSHDPEWVFIDGSIVKAYQDSCGTSSVNDEAIGKSVAGNTTKIHLTVDSGVCQFITGNGRMDWCLYRYSHLVENVFMKIT